jgi:hypothetical protein
MKEGLPSGEEHGHEVVAKTLLERELLLYHLKNSGLKAHALTGCPDGGTLA